MNHQYKLHFIREKCIAANPDIVELKFGCEVEAEYNQYDVGRRFVIAEMAICARHKKYREECYDDSKCDVGDGFAVIRISEEEGFWYEKFKPSELKSLGRPIHLADVLLALKSSEGFIPLRIHFITGAGVFGTLRTRNGARGSDIETTGYAWELRDDDLGQQSEETINFLYQLLQ